MKTCSIVLCALALAAGCAARGPWEAARPSCLDYANAASRAAMEAGYPSDVAEVVLEGTTQRHAVTLIKTAEVTYIWDAAFHTYRQPEDIAVWCIVKEGQSKGSFDYMPGPRTNACAVRVYGQ